MVYRAIGLVSNQALSGLDLVFAEFDVIGQKWTYEIKLAAHYPYPDQWLEQLNKAASLPATSYLELNRSFGQYLGEKTKQFMDDNQLDFQVQLIGAHGHPIQSAEPNGIAYRIGDGGAIAAVTGINVVSDLQTMDFVLGGNGSSLFSQAENLLSTTEHSNYKEALAIAFFALLRWREENNMLKSETGAVRNSIGGAVWMGQEW